ncbi:MAG: NDP-sugar synthase [Candidatus Thorarchaeota archaeon]
MAAGKGERLKGLTQTIPKALVPVAGKTLLEMSIERLLAADVKKITIAVGWKGDLIRNAMDQFENTQNIQVIDVPKYEIGPLQTLTTALAQCKDEEVLICPVDLLTSSDAVKMIITKHAENHDSLVTLAVDSDSTSGSIVSVDSQGRVMGIQKEVTKDVSLVRSAMLMVTSPTFIEHCESALDRGLTKVVSVLNDLIEKELSIQSCSISERWFDTDTLSDVLEANRFLLDSATIDHHESIFISAGDTMEIGDTITLGTGIKIDSGVSLKGPCLIRRNSKIGENSVIGPHASLDRDTVVGNNSEIQNAIIFGRSKVPTGTKVSDIIIYDSKSYRVED